MTHRQPYPCPDLQHTRLRPDAVLSAAAHLIGFQPTDSLLCVFIGADHAVTVTARLDWELIRADPAGAAEALAVRGRNVGSEFAFLAAVDPEVDDPSALRGVRERLEDLELEVIWAGQLHGDVWRGPLCDDAGCPEHRIDRTVPSTVLTTLVAHGHAPAQDRQTIVAEVARADAGVATMRDIASAGPGADLERWRDGTLTRVMDLLADTPPLGTADVALLCAACQDIRVRDVFLWRLTEGPEHLSIGWHRAWQLFAETLRRSPLSHVAPVGAVAALVAWQLGDGTRALECLARAREGNPDHSLAALVMECVDAAVPPTVWQLAMASMDESIARWGEPPGTRAARRPSGRRATA